MAGDAKRELVGESVNVAKKSYGLEHGLTNYGDRDFSLYLRRSFAQSMQLPAHGITNLKR